MRRISSTMRGLSLLEVCIVLVLFAVIIAVGAPNLRSSKASAESMSAANVLAEELRNARQKAISGQIPVGVIFPTDNGSKSHAQSFYIMEGEINPRITKSVDLSKQYKDTYIFNGYWELDTSKLSDPTKTNTTKQPSTGSKYDTFDVSGWGPQAGDPKANDMAYVFTPAGTVRSNGLPLFDGDFHILVTGAVAYEPGSVLPSAMNDDGFLPCFLDLSGQVFAKLTKVFDPYTITVTPLGKITVEKGVKALLESSVENTSKPFDVPPPPPPQPMPSRSVNNAPGIESVTRGCEVVNLRPLTLMFSVIILKEPKWPDERHIIDIMTLRRCIFLRSGTHCGSRISGGLFFQNNCKTLIILPLIPCFS